PAGQVTIGAIEREIKSVLDILAKPITEIGKKDFCVLAAMLAKTVALSKTNRTELIERPFHCAAAHVAPKEAMPSPFKPDLEWSRIIPSKRHEIDCPTKCQRAVFKCIGTPKDFRVTECGNIKIFQNRFAISLVEVQAVEQKHHTQRLILRCDSGPSN